jgi:hypothetical protein
VGEHKITISNPLALVMHPRDAQVVQLPIMILRDLVRFFFGLFLR